MTSPTLSQSRLGQAAVSYVNRQQWPVFPIAPGAKHPPLVKDWPNRATTDPQQICHWWKLYPQANIGLVCGRRSGVVVVDLDVKANGPETWADLLDIHGNLETLEAVTGSGGAHVYFLAPDFPLKNTQAHLGSGIDTRAEAGYVLLPPSLNESGPYEWLTHGIAPAPLPDWLLAQWPRVESIAQSNASGLRAATPSLQEALGSRKAPAWTLLNCEKLPSGSINCTLTSIAGWLRSYHPEPVVNALLQTINQAKADPPLPPEEVESIARSVCRYPQHGVNGHPRAIVIPEGWGIDPSVVANDNPLRGQP